MSQLLENYYQVLRVPKDASTTEIVAAYHATRGAFSQGVSQSHTDLKPADISAYLQRIEEAYKTLSDPTKRQHYDEILCLAQPPNTSQNSDTAENTSLNALTGRLFKQFREDRNLSLEEVFRITRIPIRYLRAIEEEIPDELPARVYLQGFIKNLAQVYKLPPQETAKLFLQYFDQHLSSSAKL